MAATNAWKQAHKSGRAQCGFNGHQPSDAMEGKYDSPADRLSMRALLDFWHLIQEDEGAYQSSLKNVDQASANHPLGINLGI